MWEGAKVLLDRAPFYAVTRPLAGAALGVGAGGLFGALGGGLHVAARATPALFLGWFLVSAAAGAAAGFIMGLCTVVDRAACREEWEQEAKRSPAGPPTNGGAAPAP